MKYMILLLTTMLVFAGCSNGSSGGLDGGTTDTDTDSDSDSDTDTDADTDSDTDTTLLYAQSDWQCPSADHASAPISTSPCQGEVARIHK